MIYSPGLLAWMCRSSKATGPQTWKTILVTAYIAGDMREQLITGVKRNQPMAGVRTIFDVYTRLQGLDPSFSVPEIDEWHQLEAAGTLETHVAAALKLGCPS